MSLSELEALSCGDILRIIFHFLPISDLGRAACVSRLWYTVASDRDLIIDVFKAPWQLNVVVGNPSSRAFWRDNSLSRFAISHRLLRGDSLASLAVKYSVQVLDIKRVNNMMSDHGIYSRERLLIPVSKADILIGGTCYIELDTHSKREVAVVYPNGEPDKNAKYISNRVSCTTDESRRRIVDSLKRSMQVDDGTAQYYLAISNGDPRAALTEFSDDLGWERRTGLG